MSIFLFCSLFLIPLPGIAGNYVVSSTSSSTNWSAAQWTNYPAAFNGTACTPATAMANAVAGDKVYFRGGSGGNYTVTPTYWEDPPLRPSNSGASGNPITFLNYPGETPILKNSEVNCPNESTGHCADAIVGVTGADYIIFDGFQFGETYNKSQEGNPGVFISGDATGIVIRNCIFRRPNGYDIYGNYQSIRISGSLDLLIQNCHFSGGTGSSHSNHINAYGSTSSIIEKCTFLDAAANHINFKDNGQRNIVRNNFFYGPSQAAIGLGAETGRPGDNNAVYQNVIVLGDFDSSSALQAYNSTGRVDFYNNTVYKPSGSFDSARGINLWSGNHTNQYYWNNIFAGCSRNLWMTGASDQPTYMDYNIYYTHQSWTVRGGYSGVSYTSLAGWKSSGQLAGGGNPDASSYYEDPQFVRAGGTNATDYKVYAAHKNGGRGGSYASVIGAYITGNEQIGYADPQGSQQPLPPTNLRIL